MVVTVVVMCRCRFGRLVVAMAVVTPSRRGLDRLVTASVMVSYGRGALGRLHYMVLVMAASRCRRRLDHLHDLMMTMVMNRRGSRGRGP